MTAWVCPSCAPVHHIATNLSCQHVDLGVFPVRQILALVRLVKAAFKYQTIIRKHALPLVSCRTMERLSPPVRMAHIVTAPHALRARHHARRAMGPAQRNVSLATPAEGYSKEAVLVSMPRRVSAMGLASQARAPFPLFTIMKSKFAMVREHYLVRNAYTMLSLRSTVLPFGCTAGSISSFSISSRRTDLRCSKCLNGLVLVDGVCAAECPKGTFANNGVCSGTFRQPIHQLQ